MNVAIGLALAIALVASQACQGSEPAGFSGKGKSDDTLAQDRGKKGKGNPGSGSGGKDDGADNGDTGDADGSEGGGGGDTDGVDSDSDTDGGTLGNTDDKGGKDEGGIDTDQGETGTEASLTEEEGQIVANLPGVEVVRVGVNFEDLGFSSKSDNDYNDAVLCFEGKFKVDSTKVVSIRKQTVKGSTYSASGCNHKVKVDIIHKDGSKEPSIEFDSRNMTPVEMKFKVGSRLEVYMTPYKGCNEGVMRNMHEAKHAKVQPNLCNQTGN